MNTNKTIFIIASIILLFVLYKNYNSVEKFSVMNTDSIFAIIVITFVFIFMLYMIFHGKSIFFKK